MTDLDCTCLFEQNRTPPFRCTILHLEPQEHWGLIAAPPLSPARTDHWPPASRARRFCMDPPPLTSGLAGVSTLQIVSHTSFLSLPRSSACSSVCFCAFMLVKILPPATIRHHCLQPTIQQRQFSPINLNTDTYSRHYEPKHSNCSGCVWYRLPDSVRGGQPLDLSRHRASLETCIPTSHLLHPLRPERPGSIHFLCVPGVPRNLPC